MKTLTSFVILATIGLNLFAQQDTISNNIYQYNGNLGVGIHNPTYTVQISNCISSGIERNLLQINNLANGNASYTGILLKTGDGIHQSVIQDYGINYTASPYYDFGGFLNLSNNSKGLMLHANSSNGIIKFFTGHDEIAGAGIERLRIDSNGNIGIGTRDPETKLRIEDNVADGNNRALIRLRNTNMGNKASVSLSLESNDKSTGTSFTHTSNSFTSIEDFNDMGAISTNGNGFSIYSTSDYGSLRFYTNMDQNGIIERLRIDSQGNIGIGTKDPMVMCDINGGLRIGNSTKTYAGLLRWTGEDFEGYNGNTWLSLTSSGGSCEHPNIYFANNSMGIGESSPEFLLDIESDAGLSSAHPRQFIHMHNINNSMHSNVAVTMKSGTESNQTAASFGITAYSYSALPDLSGYAYIYTPAEGIVLRATNEHGIIKFRTGGDNDNYERMRITANGNIGIGTNDPQIKLHIRDINSQLYMGYQPAYDGPYINLIGEIAGQTPMLGIGLAQQDYNKFGGVLAKENWAYLYGNNYNEGIAILPDMQYAPAGLYVARDGIVGIGTDTPVARLHVANGDIYISDIDKGIIMKSPDENCWRGTLDNSGNLNFVQIECPGIIESSIIEPVNNVSVKIYPVPTESKISIAIENVKDVDFRYSIHNVSGSKVAEDQLTSHFESIDISHLKYGTYILNIWDQGGILIASREIVRL